MSRISILIYPLLFSLLTTFPVWSSPLLAIVVILFFFLRLLFSNHLCSSFTTKVIIILLCFVIISLGITLKVNYLQIRSLFLDSYFVLPFLTIFVGVTKIRVSQIRQIPLILTLCSSLFLLFIGLNISILFSSSVADVSHLFSENFVAFDVLSKRFAYPSFFLMFLIPFINKKFSLIIIITSVVNFLVALYFARRNIIFTNGIVMIFCFVSYLRYVKIGGFFRYSFYIVSVCLLLFIVPLFYNHVSTNQNDNVLLENLSQRIDLDTRGIVTDYFYKSMNEHPISWFLGQGIDSEYYCPFVQEGTNYRRINETGWQQLVFKIGFFGLILFLIPLIKSVFSRTSNALIFACRLFILLYLIELFIAGVPCLDLRWVMLWMCVSLCNDKKYLRMSNSELRMLLCH